MSSVVCAGRAFLSFLSSTCAVESEWEDIGGLEFYEMRRHMAPPPLSKSNSNRRATLLSIPAIPTVYQSHLEQLEPLYQIVEAKYVIIRVAHRQMKGSTNSFHN